MSPRSRGASAWRGAAVIAAAALALPLLSLPAEAAPAGSAQNQDPAPGRYLVTLAQKPVATYEGGVAGIAPTKPASGRKVDVKSTNTHRYQDYLVDQQNRVAASAGVTPARHYSVATNGFTAELSRVQALRLMTTPGVVSVEPDVLHHTTNDRNSTDFLRLSGDNGLWKALGGTANAGRGVVVGVIDTGIWPESPSLAAAPLGSEPPTDADPYRPYRQGETTTMVKSDGSTFTGTCQTGEDFDAGACNSKLISARYFGDAWMSTVPPAKRADYISPRDGQSHGTHTATTAAGDADVQAKVDGIDFGRISGVAPGAVIATYKALWEGVDSLSTGGYTTDIVAAIDQAVADGVDVINYSVGSLLEAEPNDPIQLAFLSAASAGIFVSAAAGNSGPDPSTLDNTAPWVTTVAAGTVEPYTGSVVLGNGARYSGISTSVTAPVGPKPLITATAGKTATASAADAALCQANTLDPAKVAGTIVVCDRGVNARVAKSAEVARAGGAGMVLANPMPLDLDGDLHTVPTVHVNPPDSQAIKAYAATAGAVATLQPGGKEAPYPQVASFSSRGPSLSSKGNLLKPDIAAPGVSILAGVASALDNGRDFDFMSGTSMAAPHIAGLAALYLGKYPTMSPMQVKSALMTTATDTLTADGKPSADLFAQGAGEVTPSKMFNPGLVYDSSDVDWLGYLEGLGIATGTGVGAIDPSDYNAPSIAIGKLLGTRTVTRRVTAITPGLYRATVDLPGIKATVTPSILNFSKPGETKEFKVTFTQVSAPSGVAAAGHLTWTGGGTTVRSPIAVTPWSAIAPASVAGSGASGSVSYEVTPGFPRLPITPYGLTAGPLQAGSVSASSGHYGDQEHDYTMTVPAGTKALQFSVKTDDPGAKLGMVIVRFDQGQQKLVYISRKLTADTVAAVPNPAPGDYLAAVITLGDKAGTTSTPYHFQYTPVTAADRWKNLTVSPMVSTSRPGTPFTVTAAWTGADPATRYAGYVEFPLGVGTVVT
ncbi:S8 family peptidase, partial [Amycolatopsis rhizosphaerae]